MANFEIGFANILVSDCITASIVVKMSSHFLLQIDLIHTEQIKLLLIELFIIPNQKKKPDFFKAFQCGILKGKL
jgi:hypothetical protein